MLFCFCIVQCSTVHLVWVFVTYGCVFSEIWSWQLCHIVQIHQCFRAWLFFSHHGSDSMTLTVEIQQVSDVFVLPDAAVSQIFYWSFLAQKLQDIVTCVLWTWLLVSRRSWQFRISTFFAPQVSPQETNKQCLCLPWILGFLKMAKSKYINLFLTCEKYILYKWSGKGCDLISL